MHKLFSLAILVCFLPVSVLTPLGYVSAVDFALFAALLFTLLKSVLAGRFILVHPARFLVFLPLYLSFVLSQALNGISDVSLLLKYTQFLVVIPYIAATSRNELTQLVSDGTISKVLAIGGLFLSLICLYMIWSAGGPGSHRLDLFGQAINKNATSSILIFGAIGSYHQALVGANKWRYATIAGLIVTTSLLLEGRSAFLVQALAIFLLHCSVRGATKVLLGFTILTPCLIVAWLVSSEIPSINYYVERIASSFSTSTHDLTSSTSRILLWNHALMLIQESVVFGHGYGTYLYEGTGTWVDGRTEPHNVFLQLLYSGGLLSLIAFTPLAVAPFFYAWRSGEWQIAIALLAYVLNTTVGIAFVRGDGHLFFLLSSLAVFCCGKKQAQDALKDTLRPSQQSRLRLQAGSTNLH